MRRRVDDFLPEAASAVVQIRDDRLVLLGDERDEVEPSVLVQVGRNHVDRPGAPVEADRLERRL